MLWLEKTVVFSTSGCATTQKSNTKMKEKQLYEAPWAQTFVVQAEGMVCTSERFGAIMAAGLYFNDANSNINDYTDEDF